MAKRIRVFFINCPTLATDAAAYLILAQNTVQRAIQFEVHHFWVFDETSQGALPGWRNKILENVEGRYPTFEWISRRNRTLKELRTAPSFGKSLSHKLWYDEINKAIESYDTWFANTKYPKHDYQVAPAIVITEAYFGSAVYHSPWSGGCGAG